MDDIDTLKSLANRLLELTLDHHLVLCMNPDRHDGEEPVYWVRSKLYACRIAAQRRIKFQVVYSTEDKTI